MESLDQIVSELFQRLETHLNAPNEASEGLLELRSKLETLGSTIGKKAASDALKALRSSEKSILRSRQRAIAVALADGLKPLGIPLEAGSPLKRQRRRPAEHPAPAEAESGARVDASVPQVSPAKSGVFGLRRGTGS